VHILQVYRSLMSEINRELIQAVFADNIGAVNDLLSKGADVNVKDENGVTPLMQAKTRDMALVLIDAGANINAQDINKTSAVMYATSYADVERMLLEKGAKPDVQNSIGDTALIWCGRFGRTDSAHALLEHGASISLNNQKGETALAAAKREGHPDVTELLEAENAAVMRRETVLKNQDLLRKSAPKLKFRHR
jgi:ankyrin repeat protein